MTRPLIGIACERVPRARPENPLQGVLTSYVEAVAGAGGLPVLVPLSLQPEDLRALYVRLDGVLLPGGGDLAPDAYHAAPHPATCEVDTARDQVELLLAHQAAVEGKPLFGVCRGAQILNVALGGTLYQDLPSEHPSEVRHSWPSTQFPPDLEAHEVRIEAGSLLARALGVPLARVNSRHHQAVRDLAPSLVVAARAPDGVVEAVELPGHPFVLGVQWHPENLQARPEMRALFERFVAAAAGARG